MAALLGAILPLPILALGSSAHADWQFTRWGMTVEEVAASAGGRTLRYSAPQVKAKSTFKGSSCRLYIPDYTIGELSFEAKFCFNAEEKLASIQLDTRPDAFYALSRALASQFGSPVQEERGSMPSITYRDDDKGNTIRLLGLLSAVILEYTPTEASF